MNDFQANLENLEINLENQRRAIENARAQLPQTGIRGWIHRNGWTSASKQLNKMEADIGKVEKVVGKYKALPVESLSLSTLNDLKANLENIATNITTLQQKRGAVAEKAHTIFSHIGFTRPGKELKQARQDLDKAKQTLQRALQDPNPYLRKIVDTKLQKISDFPTLSSVVSAKKAATENKLELALTQIKFADYDICNIYFAHYKNLIGKADERSPFYFEPQFLAALDSPVLAQFAKEFARDLNAESIGMSDATWKNFERVINELKIPGSAAQALVPFLRLLILKMDDPSLLRDSTLEKLEKLIEAAPNDLGKGALQSFAWALEGLKENLRESSKLELEKEKPHVVPGNILQSLQRLYQANLQLPNRIGYVDDAHRRAYDNNPKFQALADEFKALPDFSAKTLQDFREKMIECYGEAFGKKEMEVDEFLIMWKLLIIKANDGHLLSDPMIQKLEDAYQHSPGIITPLLGVIQAIREEITHISHLDS